MCFLFHFLYLCKLAFSYLVFLHADFFFKFEQKLPAYSLLYQKSLTVKYFNSFLYVHHIKRVFFKFHAFLVICSHFVDYVSVICPFYMIHIVFDRGETYTLIQKSSLQFTNLTLHISGQLWHFTSMDIWKWIWLSCHFPSICISLLTYWMVVLLIDEIFSTFIARRHFLLQLLYFYGGAMVNLSLCTFALVF